MSDDPTQDAKYVPSKNLSEEIDNNIFKSHGIDDEQGSRMDVLTGSCKILAHILVTHTPQGYEQQKAIDCLREFMMWSKASIACGENDYIKGKMNEYLETIKNNGSQEIKKD